MISLLSTDSQRVFSLAPQFETKNSSALNLLYGPTHIRARLLEKNTALAIRTFVSKGMSLLFNTLSRFVVASPPRIWLPTPGSLLREFHGQKSLVGYGPWDCKEFNMTEWLTLSLPTKEQASSNFLAVVTVCSDFGAQENKICHCFHFSPLYLL